MGRERTFDAAEVVRAARRVFWERGYVETAVPDLEKATGLNRSSIYHAFGSKRGLFDAAVDSYLDDVIRPRLAPLRTPPVAADALETYLTGLRTAMLGGLRELEQNGCLLMNATGSTLGHDDAMRVVVSHYYADLRAAIAAGVAARRPDLDAAAADLMTTTCTSLVLSSMMSVRISHETAAEMLTTALRTVQAGS